MKTRTPLPGKSDDSKDHLNRVVVATGFDVVPLGEVDAILHCTNPPRRQNALQCRSEAIGQNNAYRCASNNGTQHPANWSALRFIEAAESAAVEMDCNGFRARRASAMNATSRKSAGNSCAIGTYTAPTSCRRAFLSALRDA